MDPTGLAAAKAIAARLRKGRLMGAEVWISLQEQALERKLTPAKRGPRQAETGAMAIISIVSPEFGGGEAIRRVLGYRPLTEFAFA